MRNALNSGRRRVRRFRFVNFSLVFGKIGIKKLMSASGVQDKPPPLAAGQIKRRNKMKRPSKYALAVFSTLALTGLATATFAEESALATAGLLKMDIM